MNEVFIPNFFGSKIDFSFFRVCDVLRFYIWNSLSLYFNNGKYYKYIYERIEEILDDG